MSQKSDNFKAGLFVIVGLVAALVAVFLMTDIEGLFTKTQAVQVRFSLKDGLKGLKRGASVTIGDFPAGQVTRIEDESEDGRVVAKIVTFEIPFKYKLYDNAVIELDVPPLGSGTELNIRSVGYDASAEQEEAIVVQGVRVVRLDRDGNIIKVPADLAGRYTAADIMAQGSRETVDRSGRVRLGDSWEYAYDPSQSLRGGVAPSQMIVDLVHEIGIDEVQRQQLRNIITNLEVFTDTVAANKQDVTEIIANVKQITGDVKLVTAGVRERRQQWWDRIDSITANTDDAVTSAKAILAENRPVIREGIAKGRDALDNAEQVTARLKGETLDKITAALDKADAGIEDIKTTTEQLKTLVVTQKPVLERMIANMRLTSDQLKLAAIEIRRSPWRLLYTPSDKELETDNLYDAARSFALAAGTLNSTAESMQAMLDKMDGRVDPADKNLRLMLENLHETFEKYAEAEKHFWDTLEAQDESGG